MDLKKQSAEIDNINANSSKTAAEADYIGKQSDSYPERVAVEIALNKANTELARSNGQLAAEDHHRNSDEITIRCHAFGSVGTGTGAYR